MRARRLLYVTAFLPKFHVPPVGRGDPAQVPLTLSRVPGDQQRTGPPSPAVTVHDLPGGLATAPWALRVLLSKRLQRYFRKI